MEMNSNTQGDKSPKKIKNIYARGADDGFLMGIYFSVLFILTIIGLSYPFVNLFAAALVLGVPFLAYYFLRRTHVAAHGMTLFSALWMQGIVMFACGSLIFGTVAFVYLRWVEPDFIMRVLQIGIDYYQSIGTDEASMLADEFKMILKSEVKPSALSVAFGWMWLGMFSGLVLSMILAGIVKRKKVK